MTWGKGWLDNPCTGCYQNEAEPYLTKDALMKPACEAVFLGMKCESYYGWLTKQEKGDMRYPNTIILVVSNLNNMVLCFYHWEHQGYLRGYTELDRVRFVKVTLPDELDPHDVYPLTEDKLWKGEGELYTLPQKEVRSMTYEELKHNDNG
jgi:hypothetical protein